MPGKTPLRANSNFLRPIRQSVSCVTKAYLSYQPPKVGQKIYALLLGEGRPVKLNANPGVRLTILMNYIVVKAPGQHAGWKVRTTAYFYRLVDEEEKELFVYHWDPFVPHSTPYPHIHPKGPLHKKHLPTGRISIEQVLRLTIQEFGVRPLRSDWEKVLFDNQRKFEQHRTWSGLPVFTK